MIRRYLPIFSFLLAIAHGEDQGSDRVGQRHLVMMTGERGYQMNESMSKFAKERLSDDF